MTDGQHYTLGFLTASFIVAVGLCVLVLMSSCNDLKTIDGWELYGVKVIRSQSSDLPVLQNDAQKLLEKDRK